MALHQEKVTEYGVTGTYWKVTYASVDFINDNLHITISLFASSTTKGVIPMEERNYIVPLAGRDLLTGNLRYIAYNYIKTNVIEFKDATSV